MGRFKKYFYNSQLRKCEDFTFGGCGGNGNRFSSEEVFILFHTSIPYFHLVLVLDTRIFQECQKICLIREEPEITSGQTSISKASICKLKLDTGLASCTDNLNRWYFDLPLGSCTAFVYSGCAGNQNRFKTFETCMGFCEGPVSPGPGPVDSYTPPPNRPAPGDMVTRMLKYPAVPSYPVLRRMTTGTLLTRSPPRPLTAPPQRTAVPGRGASTAHRGQQLSTPYSSCKSLASGITTIEPVARSATVMSPVTASSAPRGRPAR